METIEKRGALINIIIAARGTGKTYSKLLYAHHTGSNYLFLRTTKKALTTALNPATSIFTKLEKEQGIHLYPFSIPNTPLYGLYTNVETTKKGVLIPVGPPKHYAASLVDVGGVRGVELPIDEIIYDEAVRHKGEIIRNYTDQFTLLMDIYFSANRDREAKGKEPVKITVMGNSDNLNVPIFYQLGLIEDIITMKKRQENYFRTNNNCAIFLLDDSPRAKLLSKLSAIQQAINGSDYAKMAFGNEFTANNYDDCKPLRTGAYKPLFAVGDILIMEHKEKDKYYVKTHTAKGTPEYPVFKGTERDIARVQEAYAYLVGYYFIGDVLFGTYQNKILFKTVFDIDAD